MTFIIKDYPLNYNFQLKLHLFDCDFDTQDVINCKCNVLQKVLEYKYLSVLLDIKLKWVSH